jgi:hypothetical protein
MDLFEEFETLVKALNQSGLDYALCGGFAMAAHGFPRATVDVDILLEERDLSRLGEVVVPLGFRLEANPLEFRGGAVKIFRFNKFLGLDEDPLSLDALVVTPAVRVAWEGRTKLDTTFGAVPVVSRPGLVAMKELRCSGQDQDDIRKLRGEA